MSKPCTQCAPVYPYVNTVGHSMQLQYFLDSQSYHTCADYTPDISMEEILISAIMSDYSFVPTFHPQTKGEEAISRY